MCDDLSQRIYKTVEARPGIYKAHLARDLGISYSILRNALVKMEQAGLLLSENENGQLYTFARDRFRKARRTKSRVLLLKWGENVKHHGKAYH